MSQRHGKGAPHVPRERRPAQAIESIARAIDMIVDGVPFLRVVSRPTGSTDLIAASPRIPRARAKCSRSAARFARGTLLG
jgi:hypothetical protein